VLLFLALFLPVGLPADNSHLENPTFDAKLLPKTNEPAISEAKVKKTWAQAEKQKPSTTCATSQVWKSKKPSKVTVTAMKNKTIPVKGWFDHLEVYAFADPKTHGLSKGEGKIDMTSWGSGSQDRDRRVQRYVFDVESDDHSVSSFRFNFPNDAKIPTPGSKAKMDLESDITLRGEHFKVIFPVSAEMIGKDLHLVSEKEATLTYVTDASKAKVMEMIKLCNHQYLSTFANISLDILFEDSCGK
jgi:hypothetical protein